MKTGDRLLSWTLREILYLIQQSSFRVCWSATGFLFTKHFFSSCCEQKDQMLAIESYVPWTRKHWKDQVLAIESYIPWTRKYWKDQVLAIEFRPLNQEILKGSGACDREFRPLNQETLKGSGACDRELRPLKLETMKGDAISGKIPQWAILTNTASRNFIEKNCLFTLKDQ